MREITIGNSLMVCWAPLSTKAFTGCEFTSTGILPYRVSRGEGHQSGNVLKHINSSKALRRIFYRMLHVLHNSLLSNRLLYLALSFHIERVRVQERDLVLTLHLRRVLAFSRLAEELCKTRRVRLDGLCHLGLGLKLGVRTGGRLGQTRNSHASWSWRMRLGSPRSCNRIISASCSTVL